MRDLNSAATNSPPSVPNVPVGPSSASPTAVSGGRSWREYLLDTGQTYGALLALLLLILYNVFFTQYFVQLSTLTSNLVQVSTIAIVATGMTLVIGTGGIDLSVGALMAISGALAPIIFTNIEGPLGLILAFTVPVLVVGLLGLLFNGGLVTFFKVQPFVATLVLFIGGRGIAQVITNGNLQTFHNDGFGFIGSGKIFDIPFQIILMIVVVLVAAWVMRSTVFGRYILTVGGNENAARLAGVPVSRVKLAVYGITGLLSGVAGLIVIAINTSSDANKVGLNMELDAIAAVAVGGTPLTGGRVTIFGTLVGALIMQLIRTTLLRHGIPDAVALVIKAVIIIVAVYIQRQRKA